MSVHQKVIVILSILQLLSQRDFLEGILAAYERTKNGVSGKKRGGRCVPVCIWLAVWGWERETHIHTLTHTLKYQREKPPFTKTFSHTNTHLHSETAPLQYFSLRPGHTYTFTHLLSYSAHGLLDATADLERTPVETHPAFPPDDPPALPPVPTHRACSLGQRLQQRPWRGKNRREWTNDSSRQN